ncbi:cilia- and flagella-associated protein 206 [Anastrepha obliqua]|uniref:cilia- and flagella-associated protein 206 n=1 Tax=Anastrepha obliqua TaxID=95512 RepID=UPI00240974FC|nr:cilia- and flagella-associated protein 206 [Anastrepha obliqua]
MSMKDQLNRIFVLFLDDCKEYGLEVDTNFAYFFVHLLARDAQLGLNKQDPNACTILQLRQNAIGLYKNQNDPTMCNLKMNFCFRNFRELKIENMKEIYNENFQRKLNMLVKGILQYPETSSDKQLNEMLYKIQVFIIACYNIGDPKNDVLLKQTHQSLKSVLSHGDLQNFVLKKRYHRLEYLQRLTATVCGILIYNNCDPNGEKENMRDILTDIQMAKTNTRDSLEAALKDIAHYIETGIDVMAQLIEVDTKTKKVNCKWPIEKVREINKYIALFSSYEKLLKNIVQSFEKAEYLISLDRKKMDCVIEKINDVLKYRTAIESELVFPHFKYLTELWTSLQLSLSYLVELNKLKDLLEESLTKEVKANFLKLLEITEVRRQVIKKTIKPTFDELMERTNKSHPAMTSLQNVSDNFENYCGLTIALTNGLLLPAFLQKKLCEDSKFRFGFSNIEFAKYAERYFENFIHTLKTAIYTSVDLLLLFDLVDEILEKDFVAESQTRKGKISESGTQTEMVVVNDLRPSNRINITWNKWDFHRETIHLAYIRKLQTRSQQTALSFGTMNAQNEFLPFGHRTS